MPADQLVGPLGASTAAPRPHRLSPLYRTSPVGLCSVPELAVYAGKNPDSCDRTAAFVREIAGGGTSSATGAAGPLHAGERRSPLRVRSPEKVLERNAGDELENNALPPRAYLSPYQQFLITVT